MRDHLSTLHIKQLCVSGLPENGLAEAAIHTAECPFCHQRFVEELRRHRGSAPFNFTLEPEFSFRNDHVDFELLTALADNTIDQDTKEIINIHLKTCESCREDVRSFLAFRDDTAREMDISYGPTDSEPAHNVSATPWWHLLQTRPVYVVAAIVLVVVTVLIAVIALNRRSGSFEAIKHDQRNPAIEGSPSAFPSPAPIVVSTPSSADNSTKVAVLRDGGGEVTIDKNGRVTGLDTVSENSRQYIARAVLSEQIQPADVLRRLSGEQSGLRGNDSGREGFGLLYPVRRPVIEDRPVFRWESLPGVSSYRVYILDANGKQVSQSDELSSTTTQWKAPTRLSRGQIFSWVVTAVIDGKKIVSPSTADPEMKFAVLSTADFQDLTRLKTSKSHLALGVFYARVGLLKEAEREFASLAKLNPDSELPRKLLQNVRSTTKGN